MIGSVQDQIEKWINAYPMSGDVLEIGSRDICGSPRRWFTKDGLQKEPTERFPSYVGIDLVEGNLVDRVMDSHALQFGAGSFDVVVCCETLEHDDAPWLTMIEVGRVLRPQGWVLLTVPSWLGCPPHCEPDYWRFMPGGVRLLLEHHAGCEVVELVDDTAPGGPNAIYALGRKR